MPAKSCLVQNSIICGDYCRRIDNKLRKGNELNKHISMDLFFIDHGGDASKSFGSLQQGDGAYSQLDE